MQILREIEKDDRAREEATKGWVCPKCDASISPNKDECPKCAKDEVNECNENESQILMG